MLLAVIYTWYRFNLMSKIEEITPWFSFPYFNSLRIFEVFGCFNITPSGIRILGQTCKQLQTLNIGQCHKVRRIYNKISYSSWSYVAQSNKKVFVTMWFTWPWLFKYHCPSDKYWGHFWVPKAPIFKTMLSSKRFIFKSMALHLASLWNRGLSYLRMNSLLDRDLSCV